MEGLRARLSELRTVAAGGAKAAGARAAGKGARAPEPEGELARQLRRELQAEVRRRTSAERQLDEARRALTAVGERRGRGAITRAVAATMTDPEETAARIEVACDCDGLLSAAEVSTQTQGISSGGVSVETQTEAQRGEAAVLDGGARLSEMVVGKHLHPAQARAVERAERAAARIEELSAVAEASAARYRAAPTAPAALATAAPARTGGRQVRKEQARRRAAVAGMDTLAWTRAEDERRRVWRCSCARRNRRRGNGGWRWPTTRTGTSGTLALRTSCRKGRGCGYASRHCPNRHARVRLWEKRTRCGLSHRRRKRQQSPCVRQR